MALKVAIQMDPIEGVNIDGDTTFALAEAAQARGHKLWVYSPEALVYENGSVSALARPASVQRVKGDHARFDPAVVLDLATDVDVILMRQDPPFDTAYITAAHLLELVADKTLVVNDPFWVRSSPEKISPLLFHDLMPPTMVTRDKAALHAFRAVHIDVVVKPIYGNAGSAVFRVKADDANFDPLIEMFFEASREPIMIQAFVPQVVDGDKRIILVDGEFAGLINRVPAKGDHRSNLAVGGKAAAAELSAQDKVICERLRPFLKERGLLFVGIDVIAGRLTEINVTSPTGARSILALSGVDVAQLAWEAIEAKLAARRIAG
jgi:glutathione synthase